MKLLPSFFGAALLSAAVLTTAPPAQAQAHIDINVGSPAWGPPVPQGTQFYYIPEIDGYYDLYAQQYIVYRNGQWIPVAVVDGYDPYQFHPVVLDYRGSEPWVYVGAHRDRYPRRVVVVQPRPVIIRQRGLPPGQAKKLYREGYREGRYDDHDDDRGHSRGKGHGHGHGRD